MQLEESEQSKKKVMREMEQLTIRVEELTASGAKLEKTRKRLQDEVSLKTILSVALVKVKADFYSWYHESRFGFDFFFFFLFFSCRD